MLRVLADEADELQGDRDEFSRGRVLSAKVLRESLCSSFTVGAARR